MISKFDEDVILQEFIAEKLLPEQQFLIHLTL
ncbi:hypothetical protein NIVACYA_02025 [Planktothrix agardhii]|nr:hypothetical protein NIVACYA_02025 [Planktothrix agardhii]